jgi:hypothetical protein
VSAAYYVEDLGPDTHIGGTGHPHDKRSEIWDEDDDDDESDSQEPFRRSSTSSDMYILPLTASDISRDAVD